jgi:hypothetical protein
MTNATGKGISETSWGKGLLDVDCLLTEAIHLFLPFGLLGYPDTTVNAIDRLGRLGRMILIG